MADTKTYTVQSACVVVPVVTGDGERQIHTLYPPASFRGDPDEPRIQHNVDAGYIAEVGAKTTVGLDGAGAVMRDDKRIDGAEAGSPAELNDPGVVNEHAQNRAAAAAKLPEDGSAPDGRASQAVWVEYLAKQGYDHAELAKQDKGDLMKLAKQKS